MPVCLFWTHQVGELGVAWSRSFDNMVHSCMSRRKRLAKSIDAAHFSDDRLITYRGLSTPGPCSVARSMGALREVGMNVRSALIQVIATGKTVNQTYMKCFANVSLRVCCFLCHLQKDSRCARTSEHLQAQNFSRGRNVLPTPKVRHTSSLGSNEKPSSLLLLLLFVLAHLRPLLLALLS